MESFHSNMFDTVVQHNSSIKKIISIKDLNLNNLAIIDEVLCLTNRTSIIKKLSSEDLVKLKQLELNGYDVVGLIIDGTKKYYSYLKWDMKTSPPEWIFNIENKDFIQKINRSYNVNRIYFQLKETFNDNIQICFNDDHLLINPINIGNTVFLKYAYANGISLQYVDYRGSMLYKVKI